MKAEGVMLWVYSGLVLLAIVLGVRYWDTRSASAPTMNADLLPLYANVSWSEPSATPLRLATTTVYGAEVHALAATGTMNVAAVSSPFTSYYQSKLLGAGWQVDASLEAGGPGSEMTVYRKGDALVMVLFSTVFHTFPPDEPEQCPCDVKLSLFSSK